MSIAPRVRYPLWARGDLDGFFGLMVDNLVQVLLIVALCKYEAGIPDALIFERILPGVAISLILGNLFYGLQAHWVARRHHNPTCTALPYGINTPSVIAFVLFIMAPVYRETGDGTLAWKVGLFACLVSGAIEFCGAFVAEKLRRATPRAALLGVLAAVGITFIAADFAMRIFTRPMVGLLPLIVLMLAYFAQYRFPLGLPGGFLAVLGGAGIAWAMTALGIASFGSSPELATAHVQEAWSQARVIIPVFCGPELATLFEPEHQSLLWRFLAVSIPMGVINVIGSLQNIESAEAGGDRFATAPSLAVNGIGSIAAGLFGSCFPTTIYIGHPGWKALGARAGYSILNGVFFTACFLLGLGNLLSAVIPIEAGAAIVMYIGIIITAQAFQATPRAHAPAVAVALFPALAALLVIQLGIYLGATGAPQTLADLVVRPTPGTLYLPGAITLTGANSAWIVVTLILTALSVALIDRHYKAATIWCATAAVLTGLGVLHAYRLQGNDLYSYFVWQDRAARPAAVAVVEGTSLADALQASSTPTPVATVGTQNVTAPGAAQPPVEFRYRAYPIALAYALATLILGLVAWRNARTRAGAPRSATDDDASDRLEPGAG